jgi:hypothetical protein
MCARRYTPGSFANDGDFSMSFAGYLICVVDDLSDGPGFLKAAEIRKTIVQSAKVSQKSYQRDV